MQCIRLTITTFLHRLLNSSRSGISVARLYRRATFFRIMLRRIPCAGDTSLRRWDSNKLLRLPGTSFFLRGTTYRSVQVTKSLRSLLWQCGTWRDVKLGGTSNEGVERCSSPLLPGRSFALCSWSRQASSGIVAKLCTLSRRDLLFPSTISTISS